MTVAGHRERRWIRRRLDEAVDARERMVERHPPAYLTATIGTPPEDPEARAIWRDAAQRIEGFRARWLVDDPHHALGPPDDGDAHQRAYRRSASRDLRRTVQDIHELEHPERAITRSRGLSR